ncbi:sensor domain-containing protein [Coralloluteibacterium thermophilus]|uniref:Sensor domain-containing protein n=1 Tax=Coralloluteibacterium thermophilum TaxID=2707049 RepID=A0ABV9NM83_9GAMM
MTTPLPRTIEEYLAQLRAALRDADPALVQDALYDAEEYLRSAFAEQPGRPPAEVIAEIASSYGAPEEVAEIYRDQEVTVQRALRPPPAPRPRGALARFFGVAVEPRTYGALFYLALSLATGVFYFTWVVTGLALSAGLSILIVGIPFVILFFATTRVLALMEGRIVEAMLGERMPRRPLYAARDRPLLARIGAMFTDIRTWSTLLYLVLMLPLGVVYFTVLTVLLAVGLSIAVAPLAGALGLDMQVWVGGLELVELPLWTFPLTLGVGLLLLFVTLHVARGIGWLHAQLAKHLLVRPQAD